MLCVQSSFIYIVQNSHIYDNIVLLSMSIEINKTKQCLLFVYVNRWSRLHIINRETAYRIFIWSAYIITCRVSQYSYNPKNPTPGDFSVSPSHWDCTKETAMRMVKQTVSRAHITVITLDAHWYFWWRSFVTSVEYSTSLVMLVRRSLIKLSCLALQCLGEVLLYW